MGKWYRSRIPEIHLLELAVILVTAGVTWGILSSTVTAHGETLAQYSNKFDKIEIEQKQLSTAIASQAISNARIEQKVDDIRTALNIKHQP